MTSVFTPENLPVGSVLTRNSDGAERIVESWDSSGRYLWTHVHTTIDRGMTHNYTLKSGPKKEKKGFAKWISDVG